MIFACFGVWIWLSGSEPRAPSPELQCAGALKSARSRLEKLPLEKRIGPTLEVVGASCRGLAPELADAAMKASKETRANRAGILAKAQKVCAVADPAAAAQSIEAACPPRAKDPQGPILRDLDAGTYAWLRALREAVEKAGANTDAELVLSSLALSAALEGEALRGRGGPSPQK